MGTVSPLRGTNAGDIFASLLENGVVIGTSSRGVGQVGKDGSVVKYKIVTASDIEYNPSAPDAFFTALTERDNTLESVLTALDEAGYLAKMQKFDSNKALQFAATLLKTELSNKFQFLR